MSKTKYASAGETVSEVIERRGVLSERDPYAAAAQRMYQEEGKIEIDDHTVLSESDSGCYVLAWVWVSNEDAFLDPVAAFDAAAKELDLGNPDGAILALRQARPHDLMDEQKKYVEKAISELDNGSLEKAETYIDLARSA